MILKWMPVVSFGLAVASLVWGLSKGAQQEYLVAIYDLLLGCFFLLLILAMRALTD